ncbi:UNVERIFIED_CONTAM: hypothetical protein FKN15_052636 [Acipenser sinensis]
MDPAIIAIIEAMKQRRIEEDRRREERETHSQAESRQELIGMMERMANINRTSPEKGPLMEPEVRSLILVELDPEVNC